VDDVAGVLEAARDPYRRHDWAAARERIADVVVREVPGDPLNAVFVAWRAGA
jgi:hypothetical protein